MPASMNPDGAIGKNATTAITKKRFVKLDTAAADGDSVKQCDTQGEQAYGVALFGCSLSEAARGKGVSVIYRGRAIVEAGASVAMGAPVMSAADGRAITATSGNFILGYVDENAAGGAGTELSIVLSVAGSKVP